MKAADFKVGDEFLLVGSRYRCTDVGTRTVICIRIDRVFTNKGVLNYEEADAAGWFKGPPYAVAEHVFDEDTLKVCKKVKPDG